MDLVEEGGHVALRGQGRFHVEARFELREETYSSDHLCEELPDRSVRLAPQGGQLAPEFLQPMPSLVGQPLHLIEMLDAVRILLAQAAPAPCALQMRSMFEALLTIEYVTEKDSERRARAFAYLVTHLIADHEHLQKLHALIDSPLPPERIAAEQAEYEAQLARPGYREAANEYNALHKKLKRTWVRWHALYDGPKTIRALAEHAGRLRDYDILYTPWSDTVHASDPNWQIVPGRYERGRYRGLRDIAYYSTTISFNMAFFLAATERVLLTYRAAEFPVYQRWLDAEVKPRWRKLHLMRRTGPPW